MDEQSSQVPSVVTHFFDKISRSTAAMVVENWLNRGKGELG